MMATNEERNSMLRGLKTIAKEMGCNDNHIENMTYFELLDIILKDIHIRRILTQADKKTIRKLERDLVIARQTSFRFENDVQPWA